MIVKSAKQVVLSLLILLLIAGTSYGASFVYNTQNKRIAAGVLIFHPSGSLTLYNKPVYPFPLSIMEMRDDLKPSGWSFYNPLSPPTVTADIANRWSITIGQPLTKDMGCYWEVKSDAAFEDIEKFNLLILSVDQTLTFDRNIRERLRKFVDNGGVLWVDYQGGSFPISPSFFLVDGLGFNSPGTLGSVSVPLSLWWHPLLNWPFMLNSNDLNQTKGNSNIACTFSNSAFLVNPFSTVVPVISGQAVVYASDYGSGHIVATADSIAENISNAVAPLPLTSVSIDQNRLFLAPTPQLKLAYNIVNLGSGSTTEQRNYRRSGYAFSEIGGNLSPAWTYNVPITSLAPPTSAPAMLDGKVFYVDEYKMLHGLSLASSTTIGLPYDEIASQLLPDLLWPVSSPTAAYVMQANGSESVACPFIFFVTSQGGILAYNVNKQTLTDLSQGESIIDMTPFPSVVPPLVPGAPAFLDGKRLCWADGAGTFHVLDVSVDSSGAIISTSVSNPGGLSARSIIPSVFTPVSAGITAGYMRDPTTGAVDQVVCVASQAQPPPSSSVSGTISYYVMKTFNEVLRQSVTTDGSQITPPLSTRSVGSNIDPATYKLYMPQPGGAVTIPIDVTTGCTVVVNNPGPGQIQVTLPSGFFTTYPLAKGMPIVADYDVAIDYTNAAPMVSRPPIPIKTSITSTASIASAPALGPHDIIYFVTTDLPLPTSGVDDTLYAVQKVGYGQYHTTHDVVKWRWTLAGTQFASYHFVGSPVVTTDGTLYCAISNGATGYILAFDAEPTIVLNVNDKIQPGSIVTISQMDTLNPSSVQPIQVRTMGTQKSSNFYPPFVVDYDRGRLTFYNFRPSTGDVGTELNASASVIVSYIQGTTGIPAPDQVHPITTAPYNDNWNNLLWSAQTTSAPTCSPIVMGNILYVGCYDGTLLAINVSKVRQSNPAPQAVVNLDFTATGNSSVKLLSLNHKPIYSTVAGANGMLAVATEEGLTVLRNPLTLVADANKVAEIDSSGQIVWSCDGTYDIAKTMTGASNTVYGDVRVHFSRPSVAKYAPDGSILVADTGNNRIVQMDKGGTLIWSISGFMDPKGLLQGYNWRGPWDQTKVYNVNDLVSYGGPNTTYKCILKMLTARSNTPDTDTLYWTPVYNWLGNWVTGTSYNVGNTVSYSGYIFICKQAVSGATVPPSDTAHWSVVPGSTLSRPADVEAWVVETSDPNYPEYNYLVVDSGNFRVLDIVARWNGTAYENQLEWVNHTSDQQGKQYNYLTARRILVDPTQTPNKFAFACVIADVRPGAYTPPPPSGLLSSPETMSSGQDTTGGAVVFFDPVTGLMMTKPDATDPDYAYKESVYEYVRALNSGIILQGTVNPVAFDRLWISYPNPIGYYDFLLDTNGAHVFINQTIPGDATTTRRDYPGTWVPLAGYYAGDAVWYGVSIYTCTSAIASSTNPLTDISHWTLTNNFPPAVYGQVLPDLSVLITNKTSGTTASGTSQSGEIARISWSQDPATNLWIGHKVWSSTAQSSTVNNSGLSQPASGEQQVNQ